MLVALRLDGARQSQSLVACHPADLQVAPVGCRRVITLECGLILAMKWLGAKARRRHPLNWASSFFAGHANRSTHQPARERPRGCRLVYRNECGDGTDSPMRTSVRRPTAIVPSRCRVPCDASPALAECHEFATRVGCPPHRSRGRQPRNLTDTVAVHVHPAVAEPHRRAPVLLASHSGWRRSAGERAARLARRKSDDA